MNRCPICKAPLASDRYLCAVHQETVPVELRNEVSRASAVVRNSRNPMSLHAALRRLRAARTAAIQHVMDELAKKETAA